MAGPGFEVRSLASEPPPLKIPHTNKSVWLEVSALFHPNQPHLGLLSPPSQWLPESARYDVLSGNQEKAIATLKRIATENGAPMPLGKLIISRQVSAWTNRLQCACRGAFRGVCAYGVGHACMDTCGCVHPRWGVCVHMEQMRAQ